MVKSGWSAKSAAGFVVLFVAAAASWAGCATGSDIDSSGSGAGGDVGATASGATGSTTGGGTACPGATLCRGACTNLAFDPSNCGACDQACAAGELCSAAQCGVSCLGGSTKCDDKCVDTDGDPANCGGCGKKCAATQHCSAATCAASCLGGSAECGGKCVDTQIDPQNCGLCGAACAAGEVCSAGKCGVTCLGGALLCGASCVDSKNDPANCGACAKVCGAGEVCSGGLCGLICSGGSAKCGAKCVDKQTDPKNCGACGAPCGAGQACVNGACGFCQPGFTQCNATCVDEKADPKNCGGCNVVCDAAEVCSVGACAATCAGSLTQCGQKCLDTTADVANCGSCGHACAAGESCKAGACAACDSATTDCDGDGWLVADGDCCDKPGLCGSQPELVNPGALEVVGNGLDDNCNGKTDLFDSLDTVSCDAGLTSSSHSPIDYAKAIGICRQTQEQPLLLKDKTWGLIDAKILRADGSPLVDFEAVSIRGGFGSISPPTTEGQSVLVISSGIAADATQTMPGPNGGPGNGNVSTTHMPSSTVDITSTALPHSMKDWYSTPNPPLKGANSLPDSPGCSTAATSLAQDSVALYLRMRAPTNAKAFSFNSYFFSAEYPEFVCTTFNDQFIALVDTPGGTPQPIANPIDKNLMTYTQGGQQWPIGINIAKGTSLFSVCDSQATSPLCWDSDVSASSCSLGSSQLMGTGFEGGGIFDTCTIGGGTYWLTTAGNVIPGEIVELRVAIWDVGDSAYDSLAVLDGFQWLTNATLPGTGN